EIIGVLVVAEEYGIDLPDLGCRARRTAELLQRDMRQLIFTWSVEGRIGEQAEAIGFDELGGPANERDHRCAHDTKTEPANVDNVPHAKRNARSHLVNSAADHSGRVGSACGLCPLCPENGQIAVSLGMSALCQLSH